jgi:Mn2+/Fe2+ NRAMP family transporter
MSDSPPDAITPRRSALAPLAAWGPGLLVMLADADAGNVVAAAQSGAMWGYRLLPLLLLLIPALFMVQDLALRLGLATGLGFGALVRQRIGTGWAWLCGAVLALAVLGTLVTEFTGIAGVGELFGIPRALSLPLASLGLLAIVLSGAYRRVERIAMAIGVLELVFLIVAWQAHPSAAAVLADVADPPLGDTRFLFLGAALIGATFNPWMIFYQQSAMAAKALGRTHLAAARWETAAGAALTQIVTAAVLVAAAATIGAASPAAALDSVGRISDALTPFLGMQAGRLLFGAGVLGAAAVAAIVSSLALAWGIGEVAGFSLATEDDAARQRWFRPVCAASVLAAVLLTGSVRSLVWLNVAAQAANALLLPVLAGTAIVLAATSLHGAERLRGWYLWLVIAVCAVIGAAGVVGTCAGM